MARGRAERQWIDGWQGGHRRTAKASGQLGTVKFRAASRRCQGVILVGNPRIRAEMARIGWPASGARVGPMAAIRSLRFEALGGRCELFACGPADLTTARGWVHAMHDRLTR